MKTDQSNIKKISNANSTNVIKKCLLLTALITGLAACSSNQVPDHQPVSNDLQDIPMQSQVEILSLMTLHAPKNGDTIIKTGAFQTQDKVYKSNGHTVLIPRRAVLEGVYTNDGMNCTVTWKNVYPDIVEYKKQRSALPVIQTSPTGTICNPKRGIKAGDRMIVKFNPS